MTLVSQTGSSWRHTVVARAARSPVGGWLYAFRFERVPEGKYELSIGHFDPEGRRRRGTGFWQPRVRRVVPPRTGLRFECRPPRDALEFDFQVQARGLQLGRRATASFGPEGWLTGAYSPTTRRVFRVPHGAPLSWTVAAPGYQPARGDETDLLADDGGRGRIVVELEPGWGGTLHLRAASDDQLVFEAFDPKAGLAQLLWSSYALPGARVYADRRYVGRSDARGRIDLALKRRPRKIGIELDGWVGVAVLEPDSGHRRLPEALVWFVRR